MRDIMQYLATTFLNNRKQNTNKLWINTDRAPRTTTINNNAI